MSKLWIVSAFCLGAAVWSAGSVGADDSSEKVVSQGGVTVTLADVDAYMARIPADKWAGFISSADRIETMLKNLLRTKQLAQQARDMKLDQTPSAKEQLALAEEDQLAKLRFDAFAKSITVPDLTQLAKEEYLSHKDQYVIPANVTVQHVLIAVTKDRSDDDTKKLAEQVRQQALADPSKFDDLVAKYSDDMSKKSNHGVMKDATSSKYAKEFAEAASKLSTKDPISPVIRTRFGYHVLKFVSATSARQQTFDEVKAKILDGLAQQYIADQKKDFLNNLAGQEMTPYPDAIASLHDRYFTGSGEPVEHPSKPAATAGDGTAPAAKNP